MQLLRVYDEAMLISGEKCRGDSLVICYAFVMPYGLLY